jgi:hypothetical protein
MLRHAPCRATSGIATRPGGRIARPAIAAALALCAVALWLAAAPAAWAQGYSARLDLPVRFVFSGDVRGIATPKGVKLALMSGWHVGLGFETYSAAIDDPAAGVGGVHTAANYRFTDLLVEIKFTTMHVDVGYGKGKVGLDAFDLGGQTISSSGGKARQVFITLGWPLSPTWEFHVGYHEITAETNLLVNQVPSGTALDLSGVMHSLGFKHDF